MDLSKKLRPQVVLQVVRASLRSGLVAFSGHALQEMDEDEILQADVLTALERGKYIGPQTEAHGWSYRSCLRTSGARWPSVPRIQRW